MVTQKDLRQRVRYDNVTGSRIRSSSTKRRKSNPKVSEDMSIVPVITRILVVLLGFCSTTVLVFLLWPSGIEAGSFRYGEAPAHEGALAKNTKLSQAKRLYEGQIHGPETIAFHKGHLYTGTGDGRILDIYNDTINVLARLAPETCSSEEECGRPLGMVVDQDGHIVVVDSYLGLFSISPQGKIEHLFSTDTLVHGEKVIFLNDVTVTSDGVIYMTQSSMRWTRKDFRMLGLENREDGRILRYDPLTRLTQAVCEGVTYPNGIQLSRDETFLLATDSVRLQINKCYLKGEKEGIVEALAVNLPGYPDNIRLSSTDGYWVALTAARMPGAKAPFWERLGESPCLRKQYYKWQKLMGHPFVQWMSSLVKKSSGKPGRKMYGLVIEINDSGEIVRSLHDPTRKIVGISHVQEENNNLYFGSATNTYIGILPLNKNQ